MVVLVPLVQRRVFGQELEKVKRYLDLNVAIDAKGSVPNGRHQDDHFDWFGLQGRAQSTKHILQVIALTASIGFPISTVLFAPNQAISFLIYPLGVQGQAGHKEGDLVKVSKEDAHGRVQ